MTTSQIQGIADPRRSHPLSLWDPSDHPLWDPFGINETCPHLTREPIAESRVVGEPIAESRVVGEPIAESRVVGEPIAES